MAIGKPNPRGKKLDKQPGSGPRRFAAGLTSFLCWFGFLLRRSLCSRTAGIPAVSYSLCWKRIQKATAAKKVVPEHDWVKCYPPAGSTGRKPTCLLVRVRVRRHTPGKSRKKKKPSRTKAHRVRGRSPRAA